MGWAMAFVGRKNELDQLDLLKKKNNASLVVIKGRRRVGKSRLAQEFSKSFKTSFIFSGLPPDDGITAKMQRDEFIRQLHAQRVPSAARQDWGDLFQDLAAFCQKGEVLVVLDEITWMGSLDPTFLGKLKIAWDEYFKKNPKLILIISGSNSAWIEKNILSKTGFFGRISYRLTLEELPVSRAAEFWGKYRKHLSAYEILKVLSITGGIPRYLEEIKPSLTAEENIFQLCYTKEGILFNEFDDIFHDLFRKQGEQYKSIIHAVVNGHKDVDSIADAIGREKGGDLSEALTALCQDGFLSRDFTWKIKSKEMSKISQYRVKDNYFRFYLKYILPHRHKIEVGAMHSLPIGWESLIGLQFENLVINNRNKLIELLNIPANQMIMSNPYYQTKTIRRKKCQIDFMIQTGFNTLYVCEIKFHKSEIGPDIIKEMRERMESLEIPSGFSIRPVLIHVNGVAERVIEEQFFAHIINFGDFLV